MLVKGGQIADDPFTQIADGEPIPDAPIIVSLKRFLAEREPLLARAQPLGVRLETAESPEGLGGDVHRFASVVLHVAHFKDGRAFSWARLLRTRLGYKGEIRVTGHFLLDQIAFYMRVGADAFEITQNISPEAIKHALTEITDVYQRSVDGRPTIRDLRAGRAG
jgi:uncharacterized protein (DUF934 family)